VELENIASPPPQQTPQHRYASLHRAVERGLASDEVWFEMASVCLELGNDEEAVRAFRNMTGGALQNRLASTLEKRGLIVPGEQLPQQAAGKATGLRGRGTAAANATDVLEDTPPTPWEHVVDAFQYLFLERMPLLVLVATLSFPLVVGLGGFLTAGGSPFLLPAVAALPGLSVLGIVGAMGRRILVASSTGEHAPPALPELPLLMREAMHYLRDVGLIILALLGPGVLLLVFGASMTAVLPALLLGALPLPMAHALRQVRGDWKSLTPAVLVPAIMRTSKAYLPICGAFWSLFLPAALTTLVTLGMPVWTQVAMVGPMAVLPLFVSSRLLGTFLDVQRGRLGALMHGPTPLKAKPKPAPERVPTLKQPTKGKPPARPPQRPAPARPTARPTTARPPARPPARPAPVANKPAASRPAASWADIQQPSRPSHAIRQNGEPSAPRSARPVSPGAGQRPAASAPAPRTAAPATPRPSAPAPDRPSAPVRSNPAHPAPAQPVRNAGGTVRRHTPLGATQGESTGPDLSKLPGARVVSGDARQSAGASAPRPR